MHSESPHPLRYVSTRGEAPELSFEDALLAGLARDGGLYVPKAWPQISPETIAGFAGKPFADVAVALLEPFTGGSIPRAELITSRYFPRNATLVIRQRLESTHYSPLFGDRHVRRIRSPRCA